LPGTGERVSSLQIKEVHSRRERRQFLEFPWQLYRDDPNWICPLRRNQEELAGFRRHPFYDDAEAQTFLVTRRDRVCGRIAAVINHDHNRRYRERRGFFGFFESENDPAIAQALFAAVRGWLAARRIEHLRGPMNPSYNYEMGLLIDGFERPPTFMMTYNPPYYRELVEACGFYKAKDLYAYSADVSQVGSIEGKLPALVDEIVRQFDVSLRRLDTARFDDDVRTFLETYNAANTEQFGFVPLSRAEMEHMAAAMRHLVVPELTSVAEVDGRAVGTVLGMLDYNPRIKAIDGRLLPTGFVRLLWNRRAIKRARIIAAQVLPEYQRGGLAIAMMARMLPECLDYGLVEAEFSWVMEDNLLSRGTIERAGGTIAKIYRLYDDTPPAIGRPGGSA